MEVAYFFQSLLYFISWPTGSRIRHVVISDCRELECTALDYLPVGYFRTTLRFKKIN